MNRFKLAIYGVATGVTTALCAAIAVCFLLGVVFAKVEPSAAPLASMELFLHIAEVWTGAGLVLGIYGGRPLSAYLGLSMAGPLSLLVGIGGLFAGPFFGLLGRFAMLAFTNDVHPSLAYADHDIRWGAGIGVAMGLLAGVRWMLWPPPWARL
ncbi:MAG TPA: hypothetical protein VF316_08010 [Polyangiaceae bacterium]